MDEWADFQALHLANDDIENCHLIAQEHEGVSDNISSITHAEAMRCLVDEIERDRKHAACNTAS